MGTFERIASAVAGALPIETDLDMGNSNRLKNLPDPNDPQDAETSGNAQAKADAAEAAAETYADSNFTTPQEAADSAPVQSVNGKTGDVSVEGIPSGVITMWSGSVSSVPSGWTLCDGTGPTPDLRDRFIAGAGGQYNVGETGGADSVSLSEGQIPSHIHTGSTNTAGQHSHGSGDGDFAVKNSSQDFAFATSASNRGTGTVSTTADAGSHSHSVSIDAAGGDQSHENRPQYYSMAFIMKE